MARVPQTIPDPSNPLTVVRAIQELQQQVDGSVSFGHPLDPTDDTSTTLAGAGTGSAFHPGTLGNMEGAWVEEVFTTTGVATFTHYMGIPVHNSEANVRIAIVNWFHDGTGTGGTTYFTLWYQFGDTVTADSIQLRLGAANATIDGDHPLLCSVFLVPAVRTIAQ